MFKKGDVVLRCSDDPEVYNDAGGNMIDGQAYVVRRVTPYGNILLEGCKYEYYGHFFKLIKSADDATTPADQNEVEELEAKIENLEEYISELVKENERLSTLLSEREDTERVYGLVFKPVTQYSLSDWEEAVIGYWSFATRGGDVVTISSIELNEPSRPIVCSQGYYHHINGMWYETAGINSDDIIYRIK